ncbi:MAG: adenylate/guanylate cyclase domain-containing protein [Gaiellaceae bacterium]
MASCPACGKELPGEFPFCPFCAAPLAESRPAREQRKVVTVLFCDVTGSTALGERLDPESLRRVMVRYFEVMKQVVERHGGTVEKFIGDAVMAVFGVPALHEDDALRAVSAAAGMRDALERLNEELTRDYDTRLELRIGVNTGEVVTGTEERLATGDAVNVAARLEQAAQPGEILLGEETLQLARDAIQTAPVAPLVLKGKAEPVAAHRLESVRAGAAAIERHLDAPLVGRETELRRLRDALDQAARDRSCQLFTILGAAGVGKSRLAHEFLSSLKEATVVRGRCLPYGEGISYWPVVEVLKQLEPRLPGLITDELALSVVRSLLGEEEASSSGEEIAWAFRKLLEGAAGETLLVCVFDDIHWGEETFFELVEHVADLSRDAPMLLLCMARPDLLDRRPGWGGGKLNATTVLLEALSVDETDELIERLLGQDIIEADLRRRIREAAEGNPLFAEEMVAMLRDSPGGDIAVPPTIQALLAARLDQLGPSERGVLERGSVEGRVFHRGAVQALAPEELQVTTCLTGLVRKELVRPDTPQLPGEDAYRFRHLLIRDAAYEALSKAKRAQLHERFAAWLEERGADLVELDEILGYHLEQAHRYRLELGPLDNEGRELARHAAERLLTAGQRAAAARWDMPATVNLLERASALLPAHDALWLRTQPELASALIETGALARADSVLQDAIDRARTTGDERVEARALLEQAYLHLQTDPALDMEGVRAETERLIAVFERLGDEQGLARAWRELGKVRMWLGRCEAGTEAFAHALVLSERSGDRRERRQTLMWLLVVWIFGPLPAEEGNRRLAEVRRDPDGGKEVEATALNAQALFEAMQGQFEKARRNMAAGRAIHRELGNVLWWAATAMLSGRVELLADDPERAERELREGYDALQRLGVTGYLSTIAALLAEAVRAQHRLEEAVQLSEAGERAAAPDDLDAQAGWRSVRAHALAQQGDLEQAERLAREAVAIVEPTDFLGHRAESHGALAAVLRLAARAQEAAAELEEALRLHELKGDVVSAGKTRALLDELKAARSPSK